MKLNDVAIDVDRSENGAWVGDISEMEGVRVKVRSSNNAEWRRMMSKLIDAVPRKKRLGGRLDPDEQDRIMSSCLLTCCLLDWDGLEDEHGQPIPYSKEMAKTMLTDPQYRRFRDAVVWAASIVAENADNEKEEIAGNLLTLSSGSTAGERKSKAG